MGRFILGRLATSILTIVGASLIAFILMRVLPGDPARLIVGQLASDEAVAAVRADLRLDDSLVSQYVHFVSDFIRGDWGFAYSTGQPVRSALMDRLPASLELAFLGFVLAAMAALVLAMVASQFRGVVDGAVRGLSFIGLGTPPFWLGLLLLLLAEWANILPGPEGRLSVGVTPPPSITRFYTVDALIAGQLGTFVDAVRHLLLPAITLALPAFAFMVRILRTNLLEVLREPFLDVVRSKGVSRRRVVLGHALPNALLPTLTASGLVFGELLAGSVLVETVFNWPGVGSFIVLSIRQTDFAVVQSFVVVSAFAYVTINLVVDLLYGVIDPRVRLGARAGP